MADEHDNGNWRSNKSAQKERTKTLEWRRVWAQDSARGQERVEWFGMVASESAKWHRAQSGWRVETGPGDRNEVPGGEVRVRWWTRNNKTNEERSAKERKKPIRSVQLRRNETKQTKPRYLVLCLLVATAL